MDFVEVSVQAPEALRDLLIAQLFGLGFSAFQEVDDGFIASVEGDQWEQEVLAMLDNYSEQGVTYTTTPVAKQNWNEVWENNFDPVIVEDKVVIKAPFHTLERSFDYELLIMPKMSFGTGHHATTAQMVSMLLQIDATGKAVLDVGTGTGILAIMALKRGASYVEATDIDDWCRDNSLDNLHLNGYENIPIQLGAIADITFDRKFDLILANINKNVLLSELEHYVSLLHDNSQLLISGFYAEDIADLESHGKSLGLSSQRTTVKDNWACIQFDHIGR
ncbi:MAG: 50S ribosomal protein L11 methyltransferase [Bacteroidota bacterium]